jgi:hypothetical protein
MAHWPRLKGRAEAVEGSLRMSRASSSRSLIPAIGAWHRSRHHGAGVLFLLRIILSRDASDQPLGQLDVTSGVHALMHSLVLGQATVGQ